MSRGGRNHIHLPTEVLCFYLGPPSAHGLSREYLIYLSWCWVFREGRGETETHLGHFLIHCSCLLGKSNTCCRLQIQEEPRITRQSGRWSSHVWEDWPCSVHRCVGGGLPIIWRPVWLIHSPLISCQSNPRTASKFTPVTVIRYK